MFKSVYNTTGMIIHLHSTPYVLRSPLNWTFTKNFCFAEVLFWIWSPICNTLSDWLAWFSLLSFLLIGSTWWNSICQPPCKKCVFAKVTLILQVSQCLSNMWAVYNPVFMGKPCGNLCAGWKTLVLVVWCTDTVLISDMRNPVTTLSLGLTLT